VGRIGADGLNYMPENRRSSDNYDRLRVAFKTIDAGQGVIVPGQANRGFTLRNEAIVGDQWDKLPAFWTLAKKSRPGWALSKVPTIRQCGGIDCRDGLVGGTRITREAI